MTSLRWNSLIYDKILMLYPRELRHEFGTEIALVFAEDVSAAWRKKGALGVIEVWWCALGELMHIAVPGQCANPRVAVPVIAFALSLAMLGAEVGLACRHAPAGALQGGLLREAIRHIVILPSLVQAAIAWATVCLSNPGPPVSLLLASINDEAGEEWDDHA